MRKLMTVSMVVILMIACVFAVDARGQKGHHGQGMRNPILSGPWEFIEDIADQIDLTEDQLDAIKALRKEHRHDAEPQQSQIRLLRSDLRDLMTESGNLDKKSIMLTIDKITDLENTLMKANVNTTIKMKDILTEKQQDELRELRKEMKENRRNKRDSRQGTGRKGKSGRGPGRSFPEGIDE